MIGHDFRQFYFNFRNQNFWMVQQNHVVDNDCAFHKNLKLILVGFRGDSGWGLM